jgi:hypothetical protein
LKKRAQLGPRALVAKKSGVGEKAQLLPAFPCDFDNAFEVLTYALAGQKKGVIRQPTFPSPCAHFSTNQL